MTSSVTTLPRVKSAIDLSQANPGNSTPATVTRSASTPSLSVDTFEIAAVTPTAPAAPKSAPRKKLGYSKFMGITRKWEKEPNELKKVIQIPLVPLFVMLDLVSVPLLPFVNAYEFFYNRSIDAENLFDGE